MPHLAHLHHHYRRFGNSRRFLYLFSFVILFWTLFNGAISYLVPNLITAAGLTHVQLGLIMATSSAWGAFFDFLIAKYAFRVSYRWFFLLLIAVCFAFPLLLWGGENIWLFLAAMAIWGFYYDIASFGTLNFVSREIPREEYASSFGVVSVFKTLGYLLAPLLIGWKFSQFLDRGVLSLLWLFLLFALVFLLVLVWERRRSPASEPEKTPPPSKSFWQETVTWLRIGRVLWPVLILMVFLNIWDAFFWTLGPLIGTTLAQTQFDGGIFLAVYLFPSLLSGWFVGPISKKWGKKKTSFLCLLGGSIVLTGLFWSLPTVLYLLLVFVSSLLTALAWPSISGAFADYVKEAPFYEKEIEGLQDFASNWGYIIGPVAAGLVSTLMGEMKTFALLGITGILIAAVLLKFTPKEIKIKTRQI